MEINIGELQKLYAQRATLTQAMDALPSIIDSVQRQAELARNVAILEQQVQDTLANIDVRVVAAQEKLTGIAEQVSKSTADAEEASASAEISIAASSSRTVEANTAAKNTIALINQTIAAVQAKANEAEGAFNERVKQITKTCADLLAIKMAEVTEVEKQKSHIESALEAIRSKLG